MSDQRADVEATDPDRLGELQARAAASGWSIIQTADGYTVGRWGMSRTLPDLPTVEAFIRRAMRDKP
jgi:hypothetical protein